MSLTSFVLTPDVRARIKPLRPPGARKIQTPILVPPRGERNDRIGLAFDYLLRFELQRRAPHAVAKPWIAESAPGGLWRPPGVATILGGEVSQFMHPKLAANRATQVLDAAKDAVKEFASVAQPNADEWRSLAAHAIRLAKLDLVFRAVKFDPTFEVAAEVEVEELVELILPVPFAEIVHPNVMLMNPSFGEASRISETTG